MFAEETLSQYLLIIWNTYRRICCFVQFFSWNTNGFPHFAFSQSSHLWFRAVVSPAFLQQWCLWNTWQFNCCGHYFNQRCIFRCRHSMAFRKSGMCAVACVPCKDIHIVPKAELKPAERVRDKKGEESIAPGHYNEYHSRGRCHYCWHLRLKIEKVIINLS